MKLAGNFRKGLGILTLGLVLAFGTTVMGFPLMVQSAYASHTTFETGDVFVSAGNDVVLWYHPDGTFNQALDTTAGSTFNTGSAFDSSGMLYVTNFGGNSVSRLDTDGTFDSFFGSGYNSNVESILFDAAGNVYTGQADGTRDILKFDSTGAPVDSFDVATTARGTDWIDLAADQCTMFYTSEGTTVKRYDVCTDTQLTDFATGLPGFAAFAFRLLPSGGLIVADSATIVRLNSTGSVIQSYDVAGENTWFALNLDPDGTSFWSSGFDTSDVYKFDIATGALLDTIDTAPQRPSTVAGLSVFGEITVSKPDYNVKFFEGSDPSDFVLDLGQEARAVANTTDPTVLNVTFTWIDPSSNPDETTVVLVVAGSAEDTFQPDEVGMWTVKADFGNGVVIVKTLDIDFLVIPESPLGIAALVGSSIAALGAFMFLKGRIRGSGTKGLKGLGI
jgi:hypothetical protein